MARDVSAPDAPAPRGMRRRKTFCPVTIEVGDTRQRAHMLNLSEGGACLHVRGSLRVWSGVGVELDGQLVPARVSWAAGDRCGVRFLQPLTPAAVEALLR